MGSDSPPREAGGDAEGSREASHGNSTPLTAHCAPSYARELASVARTDDAGDSNSGGCTAVDGAASPGAEHSSSHEQPLGLPADVLRLVLRCLPGREVIKLASVSRGMAAVVYGLTQLHISFCIAFEQLRCEALARTLDFADVVEADLQLQMHGRSRIGFCRPGAGCAAFLAFLDSRFAGQVSELDVLLDWQAQDCQQLPGDSDGCVWPTDSHPFPKLTALQRLKVTMVPPTVEQTKNSLALTNQTIYAIGTLLAHRPLLQHATIGSQPGGQHPLCYQLGTDDTLHRMLADTEPVLETLVLNSSHRVRVSLHIIPDRSRVRHLEITGPGFSFASAYEQLPVSTAGGVVSSSARPSPPLSVRLTTPDMSWEGVSLDMLRAISALTRLTVVATGTQKLPDMSVLCANDQREMRSLLQGMGVSGLGSSAN